MCPAGAAGFVTLLEGAWRSMLACVRAEAFAGLSQSCVTDKLLQPLAAALKHPSQVQCCSSITLVSHADASTVCLLASPVLPGCLCF